MIHTIDPGVHLSAVAHGDLSPGLLAVGYIDNHVQGMPPIVRNVDGRRIWPPSAGDRIICEVPVFRTKFAGTISDLRGVVGEHKSLAGFCGASWMQRKPEEWKGQVKKPHQHKRLWLHVLTPVEREIIALALGRTVDDVQAWILKACHDLALGRDPGYDGRGRQRGTAKKRLKDNDVLDAVALLMKELGRL